MKENKHAFKGLQSPINPLFDAAWSHARERVKNNPDLRIIEDIESGFPEVVNKERYEAYLQMWEDLKPKWSDSAIAGKVLIFGTGGGHKDLNRFEDIFKNP